ncbi:MAG: hypothetical protein ACJAYU_001593 [Bradymonadia bacterium]
MPFRAIGDYLSYWDGEQYQPFFMKGINLGVGVPGTQPGQLAVTRDQYRRWFEMMHNMGINTLRVYTLHFPRFYEEFRAFNLEHADSPLYLVQGIWLDEENPTHDFWNMTEIYDHEIRDVVDALHGDAVVIGDYGKAFGTYTTDVSDWVLSWVIGREIYPDEVEFTNEMNPDVTFYEGEAVSIHDAMPMEAWLAERIDLVITHERDNYDVQRPVCFSTWPTLDPLVHPIEGHGSDEDRVQMGMILDLTDAPGGYWIIYHAYPYYPDWMVESPQYQLFEDELGPNSYYGYMFDLKNYYRDIPLVIGEFGTPSAMGSAHFAMNGMHHGGLDEAVTGHYASRMLRNMYDSGLAGGIYFAWMDEWWKRTWITDELDFPRNRRFRWHNVTAAEQNFGLLAFDLPEPEFDRWDASTGEGRIESITGDMDAEFFHVRVELAQPLAEDETLTVAWDTYRGDLGESVCPDGTVTEARNEFATEVNGDVSATHFVTRAYDSYGIWHNSSQDHQLFHSVSSDGAGWEIYRWKNNQSHTSSDGSWAFPETAHELGILRVRLGDEPESNLDTVHIDGTTIHLRLPWSLLHVTDPSSRAVLDDDRNTQGRETAITDGIVLTAGINGETVATQRMRWEAWDEAPATIERAKPSMELFAEGVRALPHEMPSEHAEDRPEVPSFWQ